MNTGNKLAKNTLIILLGKAFTQLLSFFLLPLYTATLSTEDYGFADLIFVISSLVAPIIILQLDAGLFRKLIEVRKDRQKIKNTTVDVFFVSFLFCCVYGVIYIIVGQFTKIRFQYLILFYVLTTVVLNLWLQFYRGVGNNVFYSVLCCINGVCTIGANVVFLLILKMGVEGMILAYIVGQSVSSIIGITAFFIEYKDLKISINLRNTIDILKYSIPLIFNGISWWIMNASDRVIIIVIMGLEYNGIYSVANKFSSALFSAYSIFNLSWTEIVSAKYLKVGIDEEIVSLNEKINVFLLYICGLVMNCMYIVYPLFVNGSFGDGLCYVPILIIAVYFNCMGAQLGGLLVAKKDSKTIAMTSVVGAVINITVNLMFIKTAGLYAAAGSTLASFFVMYFMRRMWLKEELSNTSYKKYRVPTILFLISLFVFYLHNDNVSTVMLIIYFFTMVYFCKDIISKALVAIIRKIRRRL